MPVQAQIQSLQYSLIFLVKLISVHLADSEKNHIKSYIRQTTWNMLRCRTQCKRLSTTTKISFIRTLFYFLLWIFPTCKYQITLVQYWN